MTKMHCWSITPPISTKPTIYSQFKSLDTNEITPISNKKPGPGWLQAHIFGGTKPVNGTPTMPFS
jgi:hypothetical protein